MCELQDLKLKCDFWVMRGRDDFYRNYAVL